MNKRKNFSAKKLLLDNKSYLLVGSIAVVTAILVAAGVLTKRTPVFTPDLLTQIAYTMIMVVSLNLVVGFLGELSLGHAGFMYIGAYVAGITMHYTQNLIPVPLIRLILSILLGGMCAMIFGFIVGLPALRLRGDYLAIVTLAFGEIVRNVIMNLPEKYFGGTLGLETPRFDKNSLFIIAFVFVLITLAVTNNLLHSKHGRAITSIRDNEIAARAMGIDVTKYKLFVFMLSSFFAGVAGVLFSYSNYRIQSANFDYNYSIEILVMVVLGGIGSINGSIIAATLITFLNVKLQTLLTGDLAVLQNLFYSLILIIIVIYNNAPALKPFREKYNTKSIIEMLKKPKSKKTEDKKEDA